MLYLAHPFETRHKTRGWETDFERRTGIKLFNPFYDYGRKDVVEYDLGLRKECRIHPKNLVKRDIKWISKCNGVVAIVDGSESYGTIQEMVYALFLDKKVYSLITNKKEHHPWLAYHSHFIAINLPALEEKLIFDFNGKD